MIYSIGLFTLDTERDRLLFAESNEVSSHSRSIQLLGALAEAYPNVVTKDQLMQKFWHDEEVTGWALSRQIYKLRQLLSSYDPDTSYIKTVHTVGFKLDVEPRVLQKREPVITISPQPVDPSPELITAKSKLVSKWLLVVPVCLLLGFVGYKQIHPKPIIYGELIPQSIMSLPINANWSSTKPDDIKTTSNGLLIKNTENGPLYVSTALKIPAFYQGASLSMKLKVDQSLVGKQGYLRLFYQTLLDGGPGEWDCFIDPKIIQLLNFEYHCVIDEKGTYTKVLADESVNLGIKIDDYQSSVIAITSANLMFPASISTDKGWTTNNLGLAYNRGVSFRPKSLADQLMTVIKGPSNVAGSKITFTLEFDDSYVNSDSGIQFFLFNKDREWKECFLYSNELTSNVLTKTCQFTNNKNPFILKEGESVQLGVRIQGPIKKGEIKIVGITITE